MYYLTHYYYAPREPRYIATLVRRDCYTLQAP